MNEKCYIITSEDFCVWHYKGELTPEILQAVESGFYDVIDITDPENPLSLINMSDSLLKWGKVAGYPQEGFESLD